MGRRKSFFPRARRRRRNDGAEVLVFLALAGLVASAVIAYVAVVAAVAIVTALIWMVTTYARNRPPALPRLRSTLEPCKALPPEQSFNALVPVDRDAFLDDVTAEAAALSVFSAWASRLPMAPRDPTPLVRALSLRRRIIGRLVTECEGRRAVWKLQPYGGRQPVTGPPISPASIDAWSMDSVALEKMSRHVASCSSCHGEGKVACGPCGGSARIGCTGCGGSGKVHGVTAAGHQRLLNCKTCRGRGDLKCEACTRGRIACPACHGTKKVETWLELQVVQREDVQVEPDGEVTRAFRWGKDGVAATRREVEADARILTEIRRERALSPDEAAEHVPQGWMDANWASIQARLSSEERIRRQTLQVLEIPSVEVTYGLHAENLDSIELEGQRLLAPPLSVDQVLHGRARSLGRIRAAALAVPPVVGVAYLLRGGYYASLPVAGLVGCVALACLAIYLTFVSGTLHRASAKRWLLASLVPLAGAAALALVAEPSLGDARRALAKGNLKAAERELAALSSSGDVERTRADLVLEKLRETGDVSIAMRLAATIPAELPQHAAAVSHVDKLALSAARTALVAGHAEDASNALDKASGPARDSDTGRELRSQLALLAGRSCLQEHDLACALEHAVEAAHLGGAATDAGSLRSEALAALVTEAEEKAQLARKEKDLEQRLKLASEGISLYAEWTKETHTPEPPTLALLRRGLEKDQEAWPKEQERRKKVAELAAKRAEELERRAEEARRREQARAEARARREERRHAYSPLLCNDGSLSPSCTCEGSWRGCCSWHGGVSGCSR